MNTTVSGISHELQNYNLASHRGQNRAEEQQYNLQTSRGRAARTEEERRARSGHRRSARQSEPPAYVSSVCLKSPIPHFIICLGKKCISNRLVLQSVPSQGRDPGLQPRPSQRSSRDPKTQLHWQVPPPAHPRMDAFETATEAGGHYGSHGHREHSAGRRGRSSQNPHHHPNPAPYCQPITTVTASASVTVAVHPAHMSNQSPPTTYPGYTATDSYCPSSPEEPEPSFQDPHVPLDTQTGARGDRVEAMELQDLEFEAADSHGGKWAS